MKYLAVLLLLTTTAHAEEVLTDLTACDTAKSMTYYMEEVYWKKRAKFEVIAETKGACVYDTMIFDTGKTVSLVTKDGTTYQTIQIQVRAMAKHGKMNKSMFGMRYFKAQEESV